MRGLVVGVLVAVALWAPALRAAETPIKIGAVAYVDLKKAIDETEEGKKANAELQADANAKRKELQEMRAELVKIEQQHGKASPKAKAQREKIDVIGQRYDRELAQRQQEITERLLVKMRKVVASIAEFKHLAAVHVTQATIYIAPGSDLTGEAVKAFNASQVSAAEQAEESALEARLAELKKKRTH